MSPLKEIRSHESFEENCLNHKTKCFIAVLDGVTLSYDFRKTGKQSNLRFKEILLMS